MYVDEIITHKTRVYYCIKAIYTLVPCVTNVVGVISFVVVGVHTIGVADTKNESKGQVTFIYN